MFQNLELFKSAMLMARHAGMKQSVTSRNVANADTPGYRAFSVKDFSTIAPRPGNDFAMKTTRPQHAAQADAMPRNAVEQRTISEPNGNGVVLENEIMNSVDAKRQHDRAIAIYRASLGMLRSTLSKQ